MGSRVGDPGDLDFASGALVRQLPAPPHRRQHSWWRGHRRRSLRAGGAGPAWSGMLPGAGGFPWGRAEGWAVCGEGGRGPALKLLYLLAGMGCAK